jgi:LmeA-like phospholipid-binding
VRKLLILGVIVGVLAAGDAIARTIAETRVEAQLQGSFEGAEDVDVALGGFPFVVRALAGSIPAAEIRSDSIVRRRIRFTDVRMTMQDLTFSWAELLGGEADALTVRDGRGRTQIEAGALSRAFDAFDADLEIDLRDGRLRARVGPLEGEAMITIRRGSLELDIPQLRRRFSIPLPRFADGLTYDSARISEEAIVLEFSLRDASFSGI